MPTSFTPRGNATSFLFKDETTAGVLPSGNWTPAVLYKHTLEEKQPYQDDNLLGLGYQNNRDVSSPEPGLPVLAGDIDVPLDLAYFGDWLKMVLGAPVTTGAGPNFVHTFSSGSEVLPHRSLEAKINTSLFYNYTMLFANKMSFDLSMAAGYEHVTLSLLGRKESKTGTTVGGTPSAPRSRVPVAKAIPVIKLNGTVLGRITAVKGDYDNGAIPQNFIGDPYPTGHDLDGMAKWSGSGTIRFPDATLYDLAKAQGAQTLELLWQNDVNRSLSLFAQNARLEPFGVPVAGPGGIVCNFNWRAEQSASVAALVATLKSPTATF